MADVSGAVNAIFTGYRKLLELYRTQVTGDPDALRHAAVKERRQAAAARAVADAIAASNTKLAKDWEAAEQVTFSTDGTTLAKKLTDTAQVLGQSADRLTGATAAVTTARSAVDAEVELFRGRMALLLTMARNVADDQVTKLLDSAKKIGVDSARQTQRISAELNKALAMLFGLPSPRPFGTIDPNVPVVGAIIGNSYGVGEGVGRGTKEGTALYYNARDRRHRSPYSAALQALERVQQENPSVRFEVHLGGSSGAVTRDVVTDQTEEVMRRPGGKGQQLINAAQLFQIPPNSQFVIADFGGNDAMFGPIVASAAGSFSDRPAEFTRLLGEADKLLSDKDPATGQPYTAEDYRRQAASSDVGHAPTLVARWLQVVDEIHKRAPEAQIMITNYPDGVDPKALDTSWLFSASQGRDIEQRLLNPLNAAMHKVVEIAGPRVSLADVSETLRGHEAYTREEWMNGLDPYFSDRDPPRTGTTYPKNEPFHPNAEGYGAMATPMAKVVADMLRLDPPPVAPDGTVTRPDHVQVLQGVLDTDGDGIPDARDPTPGNRQDQYHGRVTVPQARR